MKRFRVYFILVALMCNYGFSEDVNSVKNNSTEEFAFKKFGGGFWSCSPEHFGGYGEFGWGLTDESKTNLILRDSFTVGGYGQKIIEQGLDFGELQIGNKFSIGGVYDCGVVKIRSYGFIGTGIGFIGGEDILFFQGAPMLELNCGGGFEIQYSASNAFVIEFGGRCEGPVGSKRNEYYIYTNSSPILTIGYRSLLN